jgi:hypothetical protein
MTTTDFAAERSGSPKARIVGIVLAAWFGAAAWASYTGLLSNPPGEPPLPIFIAVAIPVVIFLAAYRASEGFRGFVLGLDPRLVTALQTWRVLGLMFVVLYAFDILPAVFALPAGLGDAAIGVAAVPVLLALAARPDFARSRAFVTFHLLGMLDFVVAVGAGTLASGIIPALVGGGVTSAPMGVLPLSLIPGFLVPLFTILHLTALFQARRLAPAGTRSRDGV